MAIPSLSLAGRVALITGARRGIGKAIALGFAEAGADVAVCDAVTEDGLLAEVAKEIHDFGRRAAGIRADVSRKADIDNLVKQVESRLGRVDILVNNAAVGGVTNLPETTEEDWDRIMDIDLKGVYLCSQAVCGGMIQRKRGCIINMASIGGFIIPTRGRAYNVAKAGVIMLTRTLAFELGRHGIRVNAIAPGVVETDLSRANHFNNAESIDKELQEVRLPRLAKPMDIVGPALFLASDASGYVTGHTIIVDGGKSLD